MSVRVILDSSSALKGTIASFSCPSGLLLNGPKAATCMGNGEWEPDPRKVKCVGECIQVAHGEYHLDAWLFDPTNILSQQ